MKLIVESGSSKTDWVLLAQSAQYKKGIGMNPYFLNRQQLVAEISQQLSDWKPKISEVFFYGAGCSNPQKSEGVRLAFQAVLGEIPIEVNSDMLGAARGMCGQNEGIVAILGTGANACYFREGKMQQSALGNGLWLGDEGSGGYLGKELIRHYLNQELPQTINQAFESTFSDRRTEILERVYRSERPNAYLASFAPFLKQQLSHPFVAQLLSDAFQAFFRQFILKLPQSEEKKNIYLVGSIAYHFEEQIRQEAQELGLEITRIRQSPLKGLIEFHSN